MTAPTTQAPLVWRRSVMAGPSRYYLRATGYRDGQRVASLEAVGDFTDRAQAEAALVSLCVVLERGQQ